MSSDTNSSVAAKPAVTKNSDPGPAISHWRRASDRCWPTAKYLVTTEVHTYAFSVAANVILSFFPALVLLMTLVRHVFRSQTMYNVVVELLRDLIPTGQDFILRNLNALVNARSGVQVASLFI